MSKLAVWVGLFRGINVGGHNKLPMAALRAIFAMSGAEQVQTYIQSGNVVFIAQDGARVMDQVLKAVEAEFGYQLQAMLLDETMFNKAVAQNPFKKETQDPKSVHLFFLRSSVNKAKFEELLGWLGPTERCRYINQVIYLHAPNGIGRSKFVQNIDRTLDVSTTARNWRTVETLQTMVEDSVG